MCMVSVQDLICYKIKVLNKVFFLDNFVLLGQVNGLLSSYFLPQNRVHVCNKPLYTQIYNSLSHCLSLFNSYNASGVSEGNNRCTLIKSFAKNTANFIWPSMEKNNKKLLEI